MLVNVDLSRFDNKRDSDYKIGRSLPVRMAWFLVGLPLLRCAVISSSGFRRTLLRWFGADIGEGAVIKPGVRVKFPWKLKLGKSCWIGEDCWIDNLAPVVLGDNVCLSQGVYLCTGSHDWSDPAFRLITRPIQVHDGAWIAARVSVGPGSIIGKHAVLGFGSVVTGNIPPDEVHMGNPAAFYRRREIGTPRVSREADRWASGSREVAQVKSIK
jgi:putative colanic acid biosynthesis acetyltransferase WcaF